MDFALKLCVNKLKVDERYALCSRKNGDVVTCSGNANRSAPCHTAASGRYRGDFRRNRESLVTICNGG